MTHERTGYSIPTLSPEALVALDPKERRTVYSVLGFDKSLKIHGVFGEENLVWETDAM